MKKWRLTHPKQCSTCPWKQGASTDEIPAYDPEQHEKLWNTIAEPGLITTDDQIPTMACHHSQQGEERMCIGWLMNQVNQGNNIALRLMMLSCDNRKEIQLDGPQRSSFEETFQ